MTANQFVIELSKRWQLSDVMAEDWNNYIKHVSSDVLEDLLDAIVENYQYQKAPSIGNAKRIASDVGLLLSKTDKKLAWYECDICGCTYSLSSRGCPQCRKMTPVHVGIGKEYPDGFLRVHRDCYDCKEYNEHVLGPACKHWGRDYPRDAESRDVCRACQCHQCCNEARIHHQDVMAYKEMLHAGRIKSRSIEEEIDEL